MKSSVAINAVSVNLESPALKDAKSVSDVSKAKIFDHFNDNAKVQSEKELWSKIQEYRKSQSDEEKVEAKKPDSAPDKGVKSLKDVGVIGVSPKTAPKVDDKK